MMTDDDRATLATLEDLDPSPDPSPDPNPQPAPEPIPVGPGGGQWPGVGGPGFCWVATDEGVHPAWDAPKPGKVPPRHTSVVWTKGQGGRGDPVPICSVFRGDRAEADAWEYFTSAALDRLQSGNKDSEDRQRQKVQRDERGVRKEWTQKWRLVVENYEARVAAVAAAAAAAVELWLAAGGGDEGQGAEGVDGAGGQEAEVVAAAAGGDEGQGAEGVDGGGGQEAEVVGAPGPAPWDAMYDNTPDWPPPPMYGDDDPLTEERQAAMEEGFRNHGGLGVLRSGGLATLNAARQMVQALGEEREREDWGRQFWGSGQRGKRRSR